MRNVVTFMIVLSCVSLVAAQSAQPRPVLESRNPSMSMPHLNRPIPGRKPVSVPANTPIVSLNGVCDRSSGTASKTCKTVITRGQLDSMIDATSPDATPVARRQFAVKYARMLAASAAAERQHLDKDPAVAKAIEAQMKVARKQVLAAALYRKLSEQAANVPASETQRYYAEHQADFEQAELQRVSIPKSAITEAGQSLDADKVKSKADEIRTRALAGGDFQQLQQDAYKDLNINASLPPTKLNMVRPRDLTQDERKVFDLKPGEVSEVVELPTEFVILKLESKKTLPVSLVQNEINPILQTEHIRKELQDHAKVIKADFDLRYLEMATAPELFPMPGPAQFAGRTWSRGDPRSRMMSGTQRWPSLQRRTPAPMVGPDQAR